MKRIALALILLGCASKESVQPLANVQPVAAPPPAAGAAPLQEGTQNVLVELFSSEGCSSCPPADDALRELDETQPVANAHVVALEFHVDYWNYLGWKDPFSSADYTARQREYGKAMKRSGVYTPQAVVDGQAELVGSEKKGLAAAIAKAGEMPHVRIDLKREGSAVAIAIPGKTAKAYKVLLARVERGLSTDVLRGENAGKKLVHAPVVRSLEILGETGGERFAAPAQVAENLGAVVFLVDPDAHAIAGAAELK